jgi:putative flippase GtrA
MSVQFSYFLLSGAIASTLNWGSRFIFSQYFSFQISVVLAFVVGLLSGFILMRSFVFRRSQNAVKSQLIRYFSVNMLALAQTLIISILMINLLSRFLDERTLTEAIAHAIGIIVPVFTSYLGHKFFTFR